MKEKELVSIFLNTRRETAFRQLYRAHTPRLYGLCLRLINGDKAGAEEIVQETWCIAIQKLNQFEWKSSLSTWLCAILINLSKEFRRNLARKSEFLLQIETNDPTPIRMDIHKAIASLPEGYREVLILHDIEGYKHKEIAVMLNVNEGTSKSQLHHARKTIREYIN